MKGVAAKPRALLRWAARKWRSLRPARAILSPVLIGIMGLCVADCARNLGPWITLGPDQPVRPPVLLAYVPRAGLVAVVSEGMERRLALWRGDSVGTSWKHWADLTHSAFSGGVDLAVAGSQVVVAGTGDRKIWIARLPLDAPVPAEGRVRFTEIETPQPVLSLAIDARPGVGVETGDRATRTGPGEPGTGTLAWLHLAYFMREAGDTVGTIAYRRSPDGGATWSQPESLASGAVGRPAVFARSTAPGKVDVCYPRDLFMAWRGSADSGSAWSAEQAIRLRTTPGAQTGIACSGNEVLVVCENHLHQVAASTSLNGGRNWEPAIAVAREGDHMRLPALDCAGGLFWAGFSEGDTAVVVRSAAHPRFPRDWDPAVPAARACCLDAPAIAAFPDSSVGVLFALPEGQVFFTRVRRAGP